MLVVKYLLWLQTGYAIWQFFRYTKFLRLPDIVLASVWNSGFKKCWFRKRKFLWIEGEPEFNTEKIECIEDAEKIKNKYGYSRQGSSRLTSFKINTHGGLDSQYTYNLLGVHAQELEKLLSHQDDYYTAYKLLPIYKDVFIIKCLPLDKAMEMVLADAINGGGGSKHSILFKEEYCVVDETIEDYLNENFLRIMSILPLSLQAKGFDVLSIYSSVALLVLISSVPANQVWQWFSALFIRYTKLTLAQFPEGMRVPVHYILSTGSEEFMFTDMYRKKTYWSKPGDFLVSVGNRVDGWVLKDELKQESELTQDKNGSFTLGGQRVEYEVEHDGGGRFEVKFKTPSGLMTIVVARGMTSINIILYKILVIDKMPSPPIRKVQGNMCIYSATIESYLKRDRHGWLHAVHQSSANDVLLVSPNLDEAKLVCRCGITLNTVVQLALT